MKYDVVRMCRYANLLALAAFQCNTLFAHPQLKAVSPPPSNFPGPALLMAAEASEKALTTPPFSCLELGASGARTLQCLARLPH